VRYGLRNQVVVHTQIRAAHDVAQAILEIEKQRHIDLILMGWQGYTPASDRLFGNTVDVILRQAASPVLLFKWPAQTQSIALKRWLVPVSGGPNIAHALDLLPCLANLGGTDTALYLCQIHATEKTQEQFSAQPLVKTYAETLSARCKGRIEGIERIGDPITEVLALAETLTPDVIVLGASRNSLFSKVVQGSIPDAIARLSNRAILLVRGPTMTEDESEL
jgi:CIC family chloride channel protein